MRNSNCTGQEALRPASRRAFSFTGFTGETYVVESVLQTDNFEDRRQCLILRALGHAAVDRQVGKNASTSGSPLSWDESIGLSDHDETAGTARLSGGSWGWCCQPVAVLFACGLVPVEEFHSLHSAAQELLSEFGGRFDPNSFWIRPSNR